MTAKPKTVKPVRMWAVVFKRSQKIAHVWAYRYIARNHTLGREHLHLEIVPVLVTRAKRGKSK